MRISRNNKGMSLIELIISMAISAIVVLMVVSFIGAAFRVFRSTNDEVNLQMEAQTVMNQLVNLTMEAKSITVKYETAEDDRYRIDTSNTTGYHWAVVIYHKTKKKLYLAKLSTTDPEAYKTVTYTEDKNLMAEFIESFAINAVDGDSSVIQIDMQLMLGTDNYNVLKKVNLRNAP